MILRRTRPELPRTFRVPWAPVTCTLGVLSCLMLLYWENWYNWSLMGAWTVIGFAIYFGYGYRHSHLRRRTGQVTPAAPRRALHEQE
jgi:APA family basic amino acid/polyamine antiporter